MILDSADIRFECSECGQHMLVDSSGAGLTATCPACESPVTVPHSGLDDRHYREPSRLSRAGDVGAELFGGSFETAVLDRELAEAREENARLRELFEQSVEECERLVANAAHTQAEIKSFQADRQQLRADLSQTRHKFSGAEAQLAKLRTQIDELAAKLAAADDANAALRLRAAHDAELSQQRLAATETQLTAREQELAQANAAHIELVPALAAAQQEIVTRQTQIVEFRQQLAAAAESMARLRQDLSETATGRELVQLRDRLRTTEEDRDSKAVVFARVESEAKDLATLEMKLRSELAETRTLREEADRRAAANSEDRLTGDNAVLRGIIVRQNGVLEEQHVELRRFRRARFAMRALSLAFGLGMIALVLFALSIFAPQEWMKLLPALAR